MARFKSLAVGLMASSMLFASPAFAQLASGEAEPPADAPSPDDPSLLTVAPDEANVTASNQRVELLEAQITALQTQLDEIKKALPKATPSWKGAPQWADAEEGWSFKVRGRLMLDAAYTEKPANYAANRNFGFNSRFRRIRLGVEGTIPGGFAYKAEADYANSVLGFGDVTIAYAPADKPYAITLGNFDTLSGMEQITSSRWSSFIERGQINDAFINTRRLGAAVGLKTSDNLFRFDAALFTAHTIDASIDNNGWMGAVRATYTPNLLGGFVHIGANYQHREFQSNDNGVPTVSQGSFSTNQFARYRARPFLQTTDVRLVDTGSFAATGDDIFGAELYGVFKSLHIGGEAQYLKTRAYAPGTISTGLDAFAGGTGVTPDGNPGFFGGHFEVGYFLTGETRGYKNGLWDRTKVLNPISKGGAGAFQITGRLDYLNLNSDKLKNALTTNFGTGATSVASAASRLARGGTQIGYLLGLTWIPQDNLRFLVNYIHTEVEGGPLAATAVPVSAKPIDQRSYSTDALAVRASFDF
jgi:phosphate-selective porin OprO/OprP